MDLYFGEQTELSFYLAGECQNCGRAKRTVLLPRYRSPGHDPSGPVPHVLQSQFLCLTEVGDQGEVDSESLPPLGCFFTVTDAENKTQTQAEGLETKPMEQMERTA